MVAYDGLQAISSAANAQRRSLMMLELGSEWHRTAFSTTEHTSALFGVGLKRTLVRWHGVSTSLGALVLLRLLTAMDLVTVRCASQGACFAVRRIGISPARSVPTPYRQLRNGM